MKYLKIFLTLIFAAAAAVFYLGNKEWLGGEVAVSVPFDEAASAHTKNGIVIAAAFLLGMLFTLIYSSLNWIDLMGRNRKISRLEGELEKSKKERD